MALLRFFMVAGLGLLMALGILIGAGCSDSRGQSGWWRYGLSGSSPFWHELHLFDEDPTPLHTMVVTLTIFADEQHAVQHALERDGQGSTERAGKRAGFRRTLKQVGDAQALLATVQPGGEYPPPARLVIMRWYRGGEWVTARFDRDSLPPAVQDLATLISGRPVGDIDP